MKILLKIHLKETKNYLKQFSVLTIFHSKIEFPFRQWIQNNLLLHSSLNKKTLVITQDSLIIKLNKDKEKDKRLIKEEIKIKITLII